MNKEVKTIKGWYEFTEKTGKGSWYDYAKVGDIVDEEVVDYFMNVLPPQTLSFDFLQMGEIYSHREDENGKVRATYMTFAKNDGVWKYYGHCFANEIINRD